MIYSLQNIKNELFVQASCMVLETMLDFSELQKLFDCLLEHGIYSDTFIDILYPDYDYVLDEIYPILRKALQSISFSIPESRQQAIDTIIEYHLKRIVEQKADIFREIGTLFDRLYLYDYNYDIFGPAEPLCYEYCTTMNTYPFCLNAETEEESLALRASLFDITKECLNSVYFPKTTS